MTRIEKIDRLNDYCKTNEYCSNCLLYVNGSCQIIQVEDLTVTKLDEALEIIDNKEAIENDKKSSNPYWERITALANKQRETGIKEYGRGLEDDTANIDIRLNRISEELIDALMYIEHLRDGIKALKELI